MKKPIYLLALIAQVQFSVLFAQNLPRLMQDVRMLQAMNSVGGLTYEMITGSPYYSDAFVESTVHMKDGRTAYLPLRYDLFKDEIEFRRDNKIFWLIKDDVSSVEYGKEILIPEPFGDDPGKQSYFFSAGKGKYSLYTRKKVDFYPADPPAAYTDPTPDRFEGENDVYYLKQEGMPPAEVRNKKTLLEILGGNEPALDFIKKSKIKVNKKEDLLELVKFLNAR